uniref:Uncharacterized protein n=1 Tax=Romanomermis culicivorax TaxID=13658 RepID=A0A915LCV8_ROMCU
MVCQILRQRFDVLPSTMHSVILKRQKIHLLVVCCLPSTNFVLVDVLRTAAVLPTPFDVKLVVEK